MYGMLRMLQNEHKQQAGPWSVSKLLLTLVPETTASCGRPQMHMQAYHCAFAEGAL